VPAFGPAGGEHDPLVGEHRAHAVGRAPAAAHRPLAEPVRELQAAALCSPDDEKGDDGGPITVTAKSQPGIG
jgi:hypothetical protein